METNDPSGREAHISALQVFFNEGLTHAPRIGSMIRPDCLHNLEANGLLSFGMSDPAVLQLLLEAFYSLENDSWFQNPDDKSSIEYENRLYHDTERLLGTLRGEPHLADELEGGWRYAYNQDVLDVGVDISDLINKLEILSLSARQSIDGLSSVRETLPKTKARAAPERYYVRLILLAFWRFRLQRPEGISRGLEDGPHGPLVDFMTSMIIDETPVAIEVFARRHREKVNVIARRFIRGSKILDHA